MGSCEGPMPIRAEDTETADRWAVDVELIVSRSILQKAPTSRGIDPGLVYNWGPVATGLRVAYQVGEMPNLGAIPLIHKGFDVGFGNWFVEAAFPTFIKQGD